MYYLRNTGNNALLATSENLLRLLKIRFMTEHGKCLAYELEIRSSSDFVYDVMDLGASDFFDFSHFCDRVRGGKRYKSYDYSRKLYQLA